jgi:NTE family protein
MPDPLPASIDRRSRLAFPGWALCLSGGGFRATLFHLGAIRRLNELGILAKVAVITSVSGGSILNGVLATRWPRLQRQNDTFANLEEVVARRIRAFCSEDLRTPLLLGTRLNLGNWGRLIMDSFSVSADFLAESYESLLLGRSLGDLPDPEGAVRFVFCSTNVKTGACWHFHGGPKARMGDFYTGYFDASKVKVSTAVAASSAFTPGFSALHLRVPPADANRRIDPWGDARVVSAKRGEAVGHQAAATVLLTDGGVYDNLGVEPIWSRCKTVIVSDAGSPFATVQRSGQGIFTRLRRAVDISSEQVGAVRRRWLAEQLTDGVREGAVWTLNTIVERFRAEGRQGYGAGAQDYLTGVRTDLDRFAEGEIACLENHGYSLADAAVRSFAPQLCSHADAPFCWPHPEWSAGEKLVEALRASGQRHVWRDAWRYLLGRLGYRGRRGSPPGQGLVE